MVTVDLKTYLTEVAEAIRIKRGHDNLLSPQDFVEEILEIETSEDPSDGSIEDSLITRTIGTYTNNRITSIGSYAFYSCTSLTSVNFPVATTIGSYAFCGCTGLTSVSFPVATTINMYAFSSCRNLTSVSFPKVTTIGNAAFQNCSKLTSVSFPVVTTIGSYVFFSCTGLTSLSFPVATTIGSYAFYSCTGLTSVNLKASSVCFLYNSNAFSYTGIWSNKGSIFVPSSLVASYKKATNWTFFSNRIFGI